MMFFGKWGVPMFSRLLNRGAAKAAPVKATFSDVLGYYVDASGSVQALKRDSEPSVNLSNWLRAAGMNTAGGFDYETESYARAYMSCVWAFRAVNVRTGMIASVLRRGRVVSRDGQTVEDHAFARGLEQSQRFFRQDLWERWAFALAVFGEAYIEKVMAFPFGPMTQGMPFTTRALNNIAITPVLMAGQIVAYRYNGDARAVTFDPDEIIYDRTLHPLDDVRGYSLIAAALNAINVDVKLLLFQDRYITNNARPGLIFSPRENRLQPTDIDLVKETLRSDVKGYKNAGRPLLMPMPFDVTSVTPPSLEDFQFLSGEQKRRVCSAVGVPAALVDYTDMAYQLSPEQKRTFYDLTVLPAAEQITRIVNADLLTWFDASAGIRFELPVQEIRDELADPEVKTRIAGAKLQSGAITINEYRRSLGEEPVNGGDVLMLPGGSQFVRLADLPTYQPPAPPMMRLGDVPAFGAPSPFMQAAPVPGQTKASSMAQEDAPVTVSSYSDTQAEGAKTELATWRRYALKHGALKASRFQVNVIDPARAQVLKAALQMIDALYPDMDAQRDQMAILFARGARETMTAATVHPLSDDDSEDDIAIKRALGVQVTGATPEDYAAYWAEYEALGEEIGATWLIDVMQAAGQQVMSALSGGDTLTASEAAGRVDLLLGQRDEAVIDAWVGSEDEPGPLLKLMLAGMAAGNASLMAAVDGERASIEPEKLDAVKAEIGIDWALQSAEAIDFARRYGYDLIRGINATTSADVQRVVSRWLQDGGTRDDLGRQLESIFNNPARAQLIAQTESTRVYNAGAKERWDKAGVEQIEWQTMKDQMVCPVCGGLHGKKAKIGEGWNNGAIRQPPAHPGCRCFTRPVITRDYVAEAAQMVDRAVEQGVRRIPPARYPVQVQQGSDVNATSRAIFGRSMSPQRLVSAGGVDQAYVPGQRATVSVIGDEIRTHVEAPNLVQRRTYSMRDGDLHVHNDLFRIDGELRGQGLGSTIFSNQVEYVRGLRGRSISTFAAGDANNISMWNGYYIWPKLGYDGDLSDEQRALARPVWGNVTRVSDIVSRPGGLEWWRENGSAIDLTFDLDDESYSMSTLRRYMQRTQGRNVKAKGKAQGDFTDRPPVTDTERAEHDRRWPEGGDHFLSDEESADLDAFWVEYVAELEEKRKRAEANKS
jgi:HK97 family phage portal protein